jgi:hypothetical protein
VMSLSSHASDDNDVESCGRWHYQVSAGHGVAKGAAADR